MFDDSLSARAIINVLSQAQKTSECTFRTVVYMFYHHPLFPTVLVCMLVRTMHEVREDMGPLVAMVMCSVPSDEPFTLIVQTSDGTAVGEQMCMN